MTGKSMMSSWYKLDNAAKIYPVLSTERLTHVFRVSATLKEEVHMETLKRAIENLRLRFPSIYVQLKKGLFWYYIESNPREVIVKEEDSLMCRKIHLHANHFFFFTFYVYHSRISIEMFHALSDGMGAIVYLKAVLHEYLRLMGKPCNHQGDIFDSSQKSIMEETEDAYEIHYIKQPTKRIQLPDAYQVKGTRFLRNNSAVIDSKMDTSALKNLAKAKGVSMTHYLSALLIYSVIFSSKQPLPSNKPVSLVIPVNLRNIFPTKTLRNFSLYFNIVYYQKTSQVDFDDILKVVRTTFENELNETSMQNRLNINVNLARRFYVRFVPLFIKWFLFRIGYRIVARNKSTLTFANFSEVKIPESMTKHIDHFTFNLGSGERPFVAMNTYQGNTYVIFSRSIRESDLERVFFNYLSEQGVQIEIMSNFYDEDDLPKKRNEEAS